MKAEKIRCLITSGPTREHLDPVRFFSNGSSGRMGHALAAAALARGWEVVLVSGPVVLPPPRGARLIKVVSASDMLAAAETEYDHCNVAVFCAAVADFRPKMELAAKAPKKTSPFFLEMVPTVDIARALGTRKGNRIMVGFAAETEDLEKKAREKLRQKNFDWIAGNLVGPGHSAMEGEENTILLLGRKGERHRFGPAPKSAVAEFILEQITPSICCHAQT